MDTVLQNDDNLQGGISYTFSFSLENLTGWFFTPKISTILQDIAQNAPSFISSPSASWNTVTLGNGYLNVTFNYTGDGSDVVSDVANELISAFSTGSNDSFSFVQATSGTSGITAIGNITQTTSEVATAAGTAVGTVVGQSIQTVTSSAVSGLGITGWVAVILVIMGLLAYFSMSTGIRVHSE